MNLRPIVIATALVPITLVASAQIIPTARDVAPRVSSDDLIAHVSFLASDVLKGRATPSLGLDIAAEYVASQFRRAGLKTIGADDYFQNAAFYYSGQLQLDELKLTFEIGGRRYNVNRTDMSLLQAAQADLRNVPALRVVEKDQHRLTSVHTHNRVVLVESGGPPVLPSSEAPAILIIVRATAQGASRPMLRELSTPLPAYPIVAVWDSEVRLALADQSSNAEIKVSVTVPAPVIRPVSLRNVVGVLPGSDSALKDTCLVVSAHYDHLGTTDDGSRVFNGANDDASGVASMIEIARALAAEPVKPRRSILFIAFFGEEQGGLGSRYYVQHPVFPLSKTIANINLEQLGRTDDLSGLRIKQFVMTGLEFTDLADGLRSAAEDAGVRLLMGRDGDAYFSRGDNARFSESGIPSTTISVTYRFSDYHTPDDRWPKLDYGNLAAINSALALAAFRVADSRAVPHWNFDNPATLRYRTLGEPAR